jgi:hypothetical protein
MRQNELDSALETLKQQFGRHVQEESDLFATVAPVYGAVTTGNLWKFLRLITTVVSVNSTEYHISQVERVVGMLVSSDTGSAAVPG